MKGKRIALLGLAFKLNSDDLREAPSLEIASALDSLDARTVGYDPVTGKAAAKKLPSLKVVFDPYELLEGAHAAVILTEWEEVRSLDLSRASALMRSPSSSWTAATYWSRARSGPLGCATEASGVGTDMAEAEVRWRRTPLVTE